MHSVTEGWRILKINALEGSRTYELVVSNFRVGCRLLFLAVSPPRLSRAAGGIPRDVAARNLRAALREFDVNDRRGATVSRARRIIAAVAIIVTRQYKRG